MEINIDDYGLIKNLIEKFKKNDNYELEVRLLNNNTKNTENILLD